MFRQPLRALLRPAAALLRPAGGQHQHHQRAAVLARPAAGGQHHQHQLRAYRASAPRAKSPPLPPFSSITHSDPRIDRLLRQYFARVEEGVVPPAAPMAGQVKGGEGGGSIFCNNALNLGKIDVIGMGACDFINVYVCE